MADAFENILGQPQVRDFLRASVKGERDGQAYLFSGPSGSNKTLAAYAFAQAVLCPKGACGPLGGSCGACMCCTTVMRKKHPDVHYYAPAGANTYLVEQIREIITDVSRAPIQAARKVYILDRVDLLNKEAANALLKTLEEPPEKVTFILLGRTTQSVLPTISSRCIVVPFRHIPATEAAGIVCQNTAASLDRARMAIEACNGSISKAIEFLSAPNNERLRFRQEVLGVMATLFEADDWDIIEAARMLVTRSSAPLDEVRATLEAELDENREFFATSAIRQIEARNKRQISAKTTEYLRQCVAIMSSWLRDVMAVCAGTPELIINTDVADVLHKAAARTTVAEVASALACVAHTEHALAYNVSPETCIDALLFEVREVLHGSGRTD